MLAVSGEGDVSEVARRRETGQNIMRKVYRDELSPSMGHSGFK